jgi:ferrous-iron efflux pump FieF
MDIKQKASLFAILSASVLALSKFSVGLVSGSMAVLSSGLDSLLDVFMSAMNFFAITKAAQPADREHPYGHWKTEDMAAVVQSMVIIFTGTAILYKASEKLFHGGTIAYSRFDLGVMVLSLVFSFIISSVLKKTAKKTDSTTLRADALHYTSDLYSNSAAIVAIVLTQFTGATWFDLLFAGIIGFIIIFSALKILRHGIAGLMDTSIPDDMEKRIRYIIDTTPYPCAGFHKMRSRLSGSRKYVDFHVLICRIVNIDEAHAVANGIEITIAREIGNVDVVSHIEPCPEPCDLTKEHCSVLKKTSCLN